MANRIIISGRLTRDIELRFTESNTPVASFSVAVDRLGQSNKEEKQADFFNCVAWNKLAETCSKYLSKGSKVLIEGRLQNQKYTKNGENRVATEIIVNSIEFLDTKKKESIVDAFPQTNVADDDELPF